MADEWIYCVRKLQPGSSVDNVYPVRRGVISTIYRSNCPGCQGYADIVLNEAHEGIRRVSGTVARVVSVTSGCDDGKPKLQ